MLTSGVSNTGSPGGDARLAVSAGEKDSGGDLTDTPQEEGEASPERSSGDRLGTDAEVSPWSEAALPEFSLSANVTCMELRWLEH